MAPPLGRAEVELGHQKLTQKFNWKKIDKQRGKGMACARQQRPGVRVENPDNINTQREREKKKTVLGGIWRHTRVHQARTKGFESRGEVQRQKQQQQPYRKSSQQHSSSSSSNTNT